MKNIYFVTFFDGYTTECFSLEEAKSLPNVEMIIEAKHSKNNDQLEFCVVYANLKKEQQKISKIDIIELK
ncbi:MAG TPA: hypothetical protein PLI27_03145 [Ignavibacteriales bacterium]|nr:hypothetical protein [Ignavibacteriales bacterium]HOL81789.1 hypothetical protein [Ignavibacteriales bacterium]HOM65837.1 hypothetical protein [Ignavibacteriales bacterium]HPD67060.1 hypothetical protein [Ignavibacteriales bacterium]HPP33926.1 hypothetical protein [Ignavibacteriales bacterium]